MAGGSLPEIRSDMDLGSSMLARLEVWALGGVIGSSLEVGFDEKLSCLSLGRSDIGIGVIVSC